MVKLSVWLAGPRRFRHGLIRSADYVSHGLKPLPGSNEMAEWIVRADYDSESRSWYVFQSDVPGLSTGAETLEELEEKLPGLITDLLELNADLFVDRARLEGSHSFKLVAHHESQRAIAA